jgi:hypothetical protein
MKKKLRLLVCYLLICAIVPINLTFADNPIDRAGDGMHIDDIVYYLSHTGSELSNSDIRNLLDQIAPIMRLRTADEVAAGITSVTTPAADETSLTLPTVPNGYAIHIFSSSNTGGVLGTDGVIAPPAAETSVDLVFTVTRISDNTTANTGEITVAVPARSPTAGDVALGISSVSAPVTNAVYMPLPTLPTGYTIAISSSSEEQVVSTTGAIVPPVTATPVNLVFTVTRISNNSSADTISLPVTIPARSSITTGGTVTASAALTGGEGMDKAFDGTTSTKWYNSGSSTGWIQYQLIEPHIVATYSVASANDSEGRDPTDWTLMGSNNGTTWTTLDTRVGENFAGRFQTNTYTFINSTSYLYYRLDVTGNSGDPGTQLSEIALYGTPASATPAPTGVIDLSNNSNSGVGFGSSTSDEVKRWQTFTANSFPNLTSVEVKIRKIGAGTTHSDVTVELFATTDGITPIGTALASDKIFSSDVGESFSSINVPLIYNGLTKGAKYAIVLGQTVNSSDKYEWSVNSGDRTGLNFGKNDGGSTWIDESFMGWLMVNVAY